MMCGRRSKRGGRFERESSWRKRDSPQRSEWVKSTDMTMIWETLSANGLKPPFSSSKDVKTLLEMIMAYQKAGGVMGEERSANRRTNRSLIIFGRRFGYFCDVNENITVITAPQGRREKGWPNKCGISFAETTGDGKN